jgi:hypothetical protein
MVETNRRRKEWSSLRFRTIDNSGHCTHNLYQLLKSGVQWISEQLCTFVLLVFSVLENFGGEKWVIIIYTLQGKIRGCPFLLLKWLFPSSMFIPPYIMVPGRVIQLTSLSKWPYQGDPFIKMTHLSMWSLSRLPSYQGPWAWSYLSR